MNNICSNCGCDVLNIYKDKCVCCACGHIMSQGENQEFSKDHKRMHSFQDLYAKNIDNIVELDVVLENNDGRECVSRGTGIIVNGYILTNKHVVVSDDNIASCQIKAIKKNGEMFECDFYTYAKDEFHTDLALLEIVNYKQKGKGFKIKEQKIAAGESVVNIGNNKGDGLMMLSGIVGDTHRVVGDKEEVFVITNTIHGGCSGGPVINLKNELIGLVVSKMVVEKNFEVVDSNSKSIKVVDKNAEVVGVSYAIPTSKIIEFIKHVEKQNEIKIL